MLLQRIANKMDELRVRTQQLPHKQIHSLCLQQEKMIMDHLFESKRFDPYSEIASVCPTQAGLRNLSNDEVMSRIQLYSSLSEGERSFSRINNSPGEEEPSSRRDQEPKIQGFCAFSQPSIRNFLDDVEESSSFWSNLQQ